ncbi:unnamed protein product [Amoebophrya sp. A120]|nr:unnamed protein product [Amoebophrya sp. A120]|eukprot:GSA120T00022732001.1
MGKAIHDYDSEHSEEQKYRASVYSGDVFNATGISAGRNADAATEVAASPDTTSQKFSTKEQAAFEWNRGKEHWQQLQGGGDEEVLEQGSLMSNTQAGTSPGEAAEGSSPPSATYPGSHTIQDYMQGTSAAGETRSASEKTARKAGSNLHAYSSLVMQSGWPVFVLFNDISEVVTANMLPHLPNQCDLLDTDSDVAKNSNLLEFFTNYTKGVYVGVEKEHHIPLVNPDRVLKFEEAVKQWGKSNQGDVLTTDSSTTTAEVTQRRPPTEVAQAKDFQGRAFSSESSTTSPTADSTATSSRAQLPPLLDLEKVLVRSRQGNPTYRAKISVDAESLLNDPRNCPFAQAAAAFVGAYKEVDLKDRQAWVFLAFDLLKSWDAFATDRSGYDRRFFYDLLTTRWPILRFLASWFEEQQVFQFPGRYDRKEQLLRALKQNQIFMSGKDFPGIRSNTDHETCRKNEENFLPHRFLEWSMFQARWNREGTYPFAKVRPGVSTRQTTAAHEGTSEESSQHLWKQKILRAVAAVHETFSDPPDEPVHNHGGSPLAAKDPGSFAVRLRHLQEVQDNLKGLLLRGKELEHNQSYLCTVLPKLDVVFVAGSKAGAGYGSFTVRGRQVARGLRKFGRVKARAWNFECTQYCDHLKQAHEQNDKDVKEYKDGVLQVNWYLALSEEEKKTARMPPMPEMPVLFQDPNVVVHVKIPCKCLFEHLSLRETIHILDPIDLLLQDWVMLERMGFSAVLLQTSLASRDMLAHPTLSGDGKKSALGEDETIERTLHSDRVFVSAASSEERADQEVGDALLDQEEINFAVEAFSAALLHAVTIQETDGAYQFCELLEKIWAALRDLVVKSETVRRYLDQRWFGEILSATRLFSANKQHCGATSTSHPAQQEEGLKEVWPIKHLDRAGAPGSRYLPAPAAEPQKVVSQAPPAIIPINFGSSSPSSVEVHVREKGFAGFYWLPLHHSNFHDLRNAEPGEDNPKQTFGVHSTHYDKGLFDEIQKFLTAHTNATFQHIDPNGQFVFTGGHILSPQQTKIVYKTFQTFDFTAMRTNQNCDAGESRQASNNTFLSKQFFCTRYKTGQRLLNHFAVGIPAVVFRETGPMDVLEGWNEEEEEEMQQGTTEVAEPSREAPSASSSSSPLDGKEYPLLASSVPEALEKVDLYLNKFSIADKRKLRRKVVGLSKDYSLQNLAWRLLFVIADIAAKTGKIDARD